MKDLLFSTVFLALLLLAGAGLTAQVTSQRQSMSRGNNDALILELPSADDKLVDKLWSDWLKEHYKVKTKRNRKSKEYESLNFSMPGVSTGSKVDMYSKVEQSGDGSELTVWIATPDGYVSPDLNGPRYYEAEKVLMRFALDVSRAQIEMEIEEQEDALKDLEKDLDRLRREKEKAEKDIIDYQKRIEEAEAAIERNIGDQETKAREIEEQIQVIEDTKRRLREF